jgi:hypothetical protein
VASIKNKEEENCTRKDNKTPKLFGEVGAILLTGITSALLENG